ncbi:ABC transporter permease [Cytobacillus sp. FSL R7-0696]|uniref:ABC transporter permease n=1 Tax=Cytobacillus sp. FSL R7-0696 TaxID=2921691 RepID=UPI0030F98EBA
MNDIQSIWKNRLANRTKELSRYLKYIFNGHIVIVMVFLIGTVAYYYQEWLKTLTSDFPVAEIMAILLGLIVTYSPIYTFLEEADRVFLLPLENKLGRYFKKAILTSFLLSSYLILIGLAVLMPLYASVNQGDFSSFFPFLIILLLVKGVNMLIRWRVQYEMDYTTHLIDSFVRFVINVALLFFIFSSAHIGFTIATIGILLLLYLYFYQKTKGKGLKWEFLIQSEERKMAKFYRVANMFTDVPHLRDQIKRRKWLDWLLQSVSYQQENTFHYLYLRTFLRTGDYLGIFFRLTAIGGVLIYFINNGIAQIVIAMLFIYLTGFQLVPLWRQHQNKLWIDLYPVDFKIRENSFKWLIARVLIIQAIIYALLIMIKGNFFVGFGVLVLSGSVAVGYAYLYMMKTLRSQP